MKQRIWWGCGRKEASGRSTVLGDFPEPSEPCHLIGCPPQTFLFIPTLAFTFPPTVRVLNDEVTTQTSFISPTSKPPFLPVHLRLVTQNIKALLSRKAFPITWATCADKNNPPRTRHRLLPAMSGQRQELENGARRTHKTLPKESQVQALLQRKTAQALSMTPSNVNVSDLIFAL